MKTYTVWYTIKGCTSPCVFVSEIPDFDSARRVALAFEATMPEGDRVEAWAEEDMMKDSCTIWVCQDCIMHHANGECGNCHTDDGHDREPLNLADKPMSGYDMVAMGMTQEHHRCGREDDTYFGECDCETMTFSWSSCEGCGSTLGGERHAMTLWFD